MQKITFSLVLSSLFLLVGCTGPDNRFIFAPELGIHDYVDEQIRADRTGSALQQLAMMEPTQSVLVKRARAALKQEDIDLAFVSAKQAVEKAPSSSEAWGILGVVYDSLGHHAEAQAAYMVALESHGANRPHLLNNLGLSYAQAGNQELSLKTLQKAKAEDETSLVVAANLMLVEGLGADKKHSQDDTLYRRMSFHKMERTTDYGDNKGRSSIGHAVGMTW